MFKIRLKKLVEKLSDIRYKDRSKIVLNPSRDWSIMLSIFFLLLLSLAIFNAYFFMIGRKKEVSLDRDVSMESGAVLNVEELKNVISSFDEREVEFEKLKTDKPFIVDPSL